MEGERVRYVTTGATTDIVDGWCDHRRDGGAVINVEAGRILAEGLSMPHSPRLHDEAVWVDDAGADHLCRTNPQTGRRENVAFCPGFLRGLTLSTSAAECALGSIRTRSSIEQRRLFLQPRSPPASAQMGNRQVPTRRGHGASQCGSVSRTRDEGARAGAEGERMRVVRARMPR
jgi:uncharacterized protein (TIGR03032 family)